MRTRLGAKREAGFTLVEIAIVLVIIGLLLGGILKGQEMITQARIKNLANDFNGVTAAYFSYQDRYKTIPGDDNQAQARWVAPINAANGNGSGTIEGQYFDAAGGGSETTLFWWHLRASGLIAGPTFGPGSANQPNNAVGGIVGVQDGGLGMGGPVICTTNVPDRVALALDAQLDDSRPNFGTVRALNQGGNAPTQNAQPLNAQTYTETGGTPHVVCKTV